MAKQIHIIIPIYRGAIRSPYVVRAIVNDDKARKYYEESCDKFGLKLEDGFAMGATEDGSFIKWVQVDLED